MFLLWRITFFTLFLLGQGYDLVREYSGPTFFDEWEFFGDVDWLTHGDVWWLNREDSLARGLAYTNGAGNAILRVDNYSDVALGEKRNSVRIESKHAYTPSTLWLIDLIHIPYGCSVWPAFWTVGPDWPNGGEIDIIEGVNIMSNNQMALHTAHGCQILPSNDQSGKTLQGDCFGSSGCTVAETQPNSFGSGFASSGGGVFATQFDITGIYIWFWSRPSIPQSILEPESSTAIDISEWGPPSANFPSGICDVSRFFAPQKLTLDITLCGDWAGAPASYLATCSNFGSANQCYENHVVGFGSPQYDEAYFEISHIRAYTTGVVQPTDVPLTPSSGKSGASGLHPGCLSLMMTILYGVIAFFV